MRWAPVSALAIAAVAAAAAIARADVAVVTATTPTTAYIDAGADDGLTAGTTWAATVNGRAITVRVGAVASHSAVLEVSGGAPPAVGAVVALPPGLTPPAPVTPLPPPTPAPPWHDTDGAPALKIVRAAAAGVQPIRPGEEKEGARVSGEVSVSALIAADLADSSTSWHDLALASQLSIEAGAWRYDHLFAAHLSGSPEVFFAPLQHARARFEVYLLRLAYAPAGARVAAALGRQPGAPLGELGGVDGGRARVLIDRGVDVTLFAGLRPASELGLTYAPRAGADVGWQLVTRGDLRARTDVGFAADAWRGSLTRALGAVSVDIATAAWFARGDATLDFAEDAAGKTGTRVTRASVYARRRRGAWTAAGQLTYDRPFVDRALSEELPEVPYAAYGARSFAELDASYATRGALELGIAVRGTRGDGFSAGYLEVPLRWSSSRSVWRATIAPHIVAGSLVDELGVRAGLELPLWGWTVDLGGSLDHVVAGGAQLWAGIGRLGLSRPFLHRWRTSIAAEIAAGDGPPRGFLFALLGYRIGR